MLDTLRREAIYLWYYFDIQARQIFWYWVLGILLGSAISVFAKKGIHKAAEFLGQKIPGVVGLALASALGIASPLCMYGTIPICAAFSKKGVKDDFLAAFMMSSILLNPQLILYSSALGGKILAVRITSCFLCGIVAGLLVRIYCGRNFLQSVRDSSGKPQAYSEAEGSGAEEWSGSGTANSPPDEILFSTTCHAKQNLGSTPVACVGNARMEKKSYFDFTGFDSPRDHDTDKNRFLRYVKNVLRNIRATGPWFLIGIALSAVFQRYVPDDVMSRVFGGSKAWGVLMAATVGVPLYVCGGGTIPLLLDWLSDGMSAGSAAAFMITGPATKITNLGALKVALGVRHFALYILFVMAFSFATGILVNLIL